MKYVAVAVAGESQVLLVTLTKAWSIDVSQEDVSAKQHVLTLGPGTDTPKLDAAVHNYCCKVHLCCSWEDMLTCTPSSSLWFLSRFIFMIWVFSRYLHEVGSQLVCVQVWLALTGNTFFGTDLVTCVRLPCGSHVDNMLANVETFLHVIHINLGQKPHVLHVQVTWIAHGGWLAWIWVPRVP